MTAKQTSFVQNDLDHRGGQPTKPEPLRARRDDPETSKQAAREMRDSGAMAKQAREVLEIVRANPGKTASELAALPEVKLDRYQIQRRISDLRHTAIDRGPSRRCRVTHKRAHTWDAR